MTITFQRILNRAAQAVEEAELALVAASTSGDGLVVPVGEVERTFSESRAERIMPRLGSDQHLPSGGRVRGCA